jgi:glutathione synthase/RimK-type ligase-like ATP-grasp enzyme
MTTLGVLVPFHPDEDPGPPEATALGRAALVLRDEGVRIVFGDHVDGAALAGLEAVPGRWERASAEVSAVYDRYPSQKLAAAHAAILSGLRVPVANPPSLAELCRDKLDAQRFLEGHGVAMPAVEADPDAFAARLDAWGAAFHKPRFGAFGAGIRKVRPGDALPGAVRGLQAEEEPAILQRAVQAPTGWAGISVRALAHRMPGGDFALAPLVARRHREDPVVNVARGAEAAPAEDVLAPDTVAAVIREATSACEALAKHEDGAWLVEVGVDLAISDDERPWVIEVNGRPRGRVAALAGADPDRFGRAHLEAALRPLRFLAVAASGHGS